MHECMGSGHLLLYSMAVKGYGYRTWHEIQATGMAQHKPAGMGTAQHKAYKLQQA
jgi:hypothetical protein